MTPTELAALRPDEPAWLDLRGVLLSGRCETFVNDEPSSGFVARALDHAVAVAAGEPSVEVVRASVASAEADAASPAPDEWHLLGGAESERALAAALPGWRRRGVTLHERGREPELPASTSVELRLAPDGWEAAGLGLDHLPPALRAEYAMPSIRRAPMAAAIVDGRAVAFCFVAVASETLWDVAVDTLEPFRRRGLATSCFEALAGEMTTRGKRPIWGALDANAPSMRLARRLGFEPCARLASFVRG